MNRRISRISSLLLGSAMLIPGNMVALLAEGETPEYLPGATVVADADSPSGYTVHFVYDGKDQVISKL